MTVSFARHKEREPRLSMLLTFVVPEHPCRDNQLSSTLGPVGCLGPNSTALPEEIPDLRERETGTDMFWK